MGLELRGYREHTGGPGCGTSGSLRVYNRTLSSLAGYEASSYHVIDARSTLSPASGTSPWLLPRFRVSDAIRIMRLCSGFLPFPGQVQLESNQESVLSFNSKLFQDGKW